MTKEEGITTLFFWEEDHCRTAWETEVFHAEQTLQRAGIATSAER